MFRKFSNKKDSGYDIEQSILIDSNGQKLNRIPSSDATSKTTYTVSFWVKGDAIPKGAGSTSNGVIKIYLSAGGHAANSGYTDFVAINAETEGDFTLDWHIAKTAGVEGRLQTVRKFRDPSAWIHLVFVFDTTNANPTERMRIYVNGERENEFSNSIYPSQNFNSILWNSLSEGQYIGNYGYFDDPYYSNGPSPAMAYMSDFISIDGLALGPEHFALEDSDGVYNPIKYTGDYGTNGFHLEFKADGIGTDSSGNGNDFATSGITPDNIVADSPSNNYCTWNPLDSSYNTVFSYGNLETYAPSTAAPYDYQSSRGTISLESGKWYWEVEVTHGLVVQYSALQFGVINDIDISGGGVTTDYDGVEWDSRGYWYYNSLGLAAPPYSIGDKLSVAFDADTQDIWFGKNGVWLSGTADGLNGGDPATGTTPTFNLSNFNVAKYWPVISPNIDVRTLSNFGQRAFAYNPPEGYKALCTDNLPNPLVDPRKNFSVNTWSGNTQSNPIVTGFQPGLVWVKRRDTSYDHYLVDTVRGRTKALSSNDIGPEEPKASGIVSWDGSGFATGPDVGFSGTSMVGWTFKAGDTVTNNDGSIPSEVSVNKDMGFSIVKYIGDQIEGSTVGHGLGAVPQIIIAKNLDISTGGGESWVVSIGNVNGVVGDFMTLNTSAPVNKGGGQFPVNPGNTVWTLGGAPNANASGSPNIAYCFANTEMLQVGQYTGNGSGSIGEISNGTFLSLPFKPAFFMVKGIDNTSSWQVWDSTRTPYNPSPIILQPDTAEAEANNPGAYEIDMLSNGVKFRTGFGGNNASGVSYLYLAISEQSFKNTRGR